jgi:hypothetical protein
MSSSVVSGGVVHTVPMDVRRVLIASPKAMAAWEDLTPLARNEWLGCTHRKDKELSPSVRWVLSHRSKASA